MHAISLLKSKNLKCEYLEEGKLLLYPSFLEQKDAQDSFILLFHTYKFLIRKKCCFSTMQLQRLYHGAFQSGSHIPKNAVIFNKFTLLIATHFEYFTLPSSLEAIEKFLQKIELRYHNPNLSILMQELLLNAFEYGSLQISASDKESLIAQERYYKYLSHTTSSKNIYIRIAHIPSFLVVQIEDEGEGFDTDNYNIQSRLFSGRGIMLAKNLATALAYNAKGNCATFLYRIENGKKAF